MAEQIKQIDIIDPQALKLIASDLESISKQGEKADTAIIELSKSMKNLKFPKSDTQSMVEMEKSIDKVNKLYVSKIAVEKENIKIEQEKERLRGITEKNERARAKAEEQRQRAELKAQKDVAGAYQETQKRASELYKQLRNLAIEGKTNTKEFKSLKSEYDRLDSSLKKVDESFGKYQRNVGNYGSGVGKLTGLLGKLGVAFSGLSLARSAGEALVDYENKLASFRTIVSDLNDKEFDKFKDKIKDVATSTKASSTDVAQSFEAIAGLNSSFAETAEGLGKVSEAAITLSKASGDDLTVSTENLVSIMNQFSMGAEESNRAINILAAGQAVGAASISQLSESFKNVGSVAASSNISMEQSVGLLETLGKFSLTGAEAGTKLRGVILQLQKSNLGYASGQFNINDALAEYNEKLKGAKTEAEKNEIAQKVFGAENITAGKILSQNTELIEKYTKGVTGTTEAQKAAEINSNTLSNRLKEFKNTLTTLITTNETFTNSLHFLASNLPTIVTWIGKAVVSFVAFKTVMFALKIKDKVSEIGGLKGAFQSLIDNVKNGASGVGKFASAITSIGWTALISFATQAALKFYDLASGAELAKIKFEQFKKATDIGSKEGNKFLEKLEKDAQKTKEALVKSGVDIKKGLEDINKDYEKKLRERIRLLESSQKDLKGKFFNKDFQSQFKESQGGIINTLYRMSGVPTEQDITFAKGVAWRSVMKRNTAELDVLYKKLREIKNSKTDKVIDDLLISEEPGQRTLNLKNQTKALADYTKALADLQAEGLTGYSKEALELTNKYYDEIGKIEDNGIKAKEYRKKLKLKLERDLIALEAKYNKENEDNLKEHYENINKINLDFETQRLETNERTQELSVLQKYYNDREKIINDASLTDEERQNRFSDLEKKRQEDDLKRLIENEQKKIEVLQSFRQKTVNADGTISDTDLLKTADSDLSEDDLAKKKEFEKNITDYQINITNAEIELQKLRGTANENLVKTTESTWERISKSISSILDALQNKINEMYDKQIAKEQQLIEKSKGRVDYLKEAAALGNQQATESILAEEKRQEEALRKIEKIEKKKQRSQFITSSLSMLQQKIASGDKNAVMSTISDSAMLTAFLSSLPSFDKGTEFVNVNGKGIDGKGGQLAIIHHGERIIPAHENKMIGYSLSNKDVAERFTEKNNVIDFAPIVHEIKSGFANITTVNYDVNNIVNNILEVVTTTRKGRVTIIDKNRYKA